ncbi:TonB-dependent receptor [Sphingomonas sp. G-3-2-10]|uniref:TonB-dependent receptor n=1 Tax=Sphingomonas sp. G-3-2-10 TaxID=2728838 RepID=UPI00146DB009|nr:TonB-dependent receptor [Sphingomonas sp. G-3-2-10]NML06611.1 TonB-dependent receptor [Sphingomonas sp. G-3-2-10]
MPNRSRDNTNSRHGRAMHIAAALMLGTSMAAIAIAPAHAQVSEASLRGTITMPDGSTATEVVAVEVGSGYRRTAEVRSDGSYNFASLRPGTYRLEITTTAGPRTTDEFRLAVAQTAVLDFDFAGESAGASNEIVVTGGQLRTAQGGEVGKTISSRLIDQLPQNNRNFLAFADLAPGVQFVTNGSDQSRVQGGAQNSSTVNVFIDGVGQKDYVLKNGITGQDSTQGNPFPQLAVGEYRVISSNYKAEFDQVSSVAITAITKSGTNEFHGEGFIDFTNQDFRDWRPSELTVKVPSRDLQFGGALGGPIIRDVLHFFVTYEGKRRTSPRDITPGLSLPVSYFPSSLQGVFGSTNETFNENLYFGKLSFAPTDKDLFEFSGKYRDESGEQFNSGINAYETRTLARVVEWRGLARWQHTEDTWNNDFKVAYEDVSWNPSPFLEQPRFFYNVQIQNPGGSIQRGDVLSTGGGTNFQDKGQKGWQVSDDFTFTGFAGHTIKVGAKAKWVTLQSLQLNGYNPTFRYFTPVGGAFNTTTPYQMTFQTTVGVDPQIESANFQFGIYAQDDWDVTDRLTLNLGVRWDYERTPAFLDYVHPAAQVTAVGPANYPNLTNANYNIRDYISTGSERKAFTGAWQPRLGFSWDLDEDGRFTIFGGFGRSYDRTQFDFIQQELAQGQAAGRTFNFNNPGDTVNVCVPSATCIAWNPVYLTQAGRDALVAGLPAGAGRELRFIKNDLKTPYSDQFSLGVRGRFGNVDLEVGYSHVSSHDGFVYLLGNRRANGSFFPATGNPDSPFGFAPAPFGSIIIGDNGIETRADTGYAKLTKRYTPASPWSLDATYTYTKAEENRQFGEVFSLDFPSIQDYPFAPSSGIRTHRFVAAGTVDLPIGVTMAAKFQIASPIWMKALIGIPGTPPNRTVTSVETEGNGDRWGFRQMDLSVTKYLPLRFLTDDTQIWVRVDVINLFDDRNYNGFNNITGLRNTSLATDGPPRTVKVSTGFRF